ncbi:MAG: hypothetical protein ACR2GY_10775 [Phycisphaerales bacterium]
MDMHIRTTFMAALLCSGMAMMTTPALAQDETQPDGSGVAAADLPAATELCQKAVEAMGGSAAIAEIKSVKLKMKMTMEDHMGGPEIDYVDAICVLPNKLHLTAHFKDGTSAVAVFDGKHGWSSEPGMEGYNVMSPEEFGMFSIMVPHTLLLSLDQHMGEKKTVEMKSIDGTDYARVDVKNKEGAPVGSLMIDPASGKIGAFGIDNEMMGMMMMVNFSKWEDVKGIMLPTEAKMDAAFMQMALGYSDFAFNTAEESLFKMPAEVAEEIKAMEEDGGYDIETISIHPADDDDDDDDGIDDDDDDDDDNDDRS